MENSSSTRDVLDYEASRPAKSLFEKLWSFVFYSLLVVIGLVFVLALIGIVLVETNR